MVEGVTALGRRVSEFERLETFLKPPGLDAVSIHCDEVTAKCPVTGQPDFYDIYIDYAVNRLCVESKTIKLYFQQYREQGLFCEAFAAKIAEDFATALQTAVVAKVCQKSRGGVALTSIASFNWSSHEPAPKSAVN